MAERAPRCKLLPVRICLPVPMGERGECKPARSQCDGTQTLSHKTNLPNAHHSLDFFFFYSFLFFFFSLTL
jgi:hypothetical protein